MFYADIASLSPESFRRLTGVQRDTFNAMLRVVVKSSSKFGRPAKLSDADQLLLALMYWREYRTQFHIAADYQISEPTCSRIVRRIEDILAEHPQFRLPKKLPSRVGSLSIATVIIDVTETPLQRPKKSKKSTTAARRSAIR
jgi:hypothetical protein